jgi:hypothetical protein
VVELFYALMDYRYRWRLPVLALFHFLKEVLVQGWPGG